MTNASSVMLAPSTSGTFDPNRPDSRPPIGAATSIISVDGIRKSPACVTEEPKPYPVDDRRLDELGDEHERAVHPEPDQEAHEVGRPDAA